MDPMAFFDRNTEQYLTSTQIANVQSMVNTYNTFLLTETNMRNILLCGRSRSGKSTVANMLADLFYCPPAPEMFSSTVDTSVKTFSVAAHTINIIDTPGLCEIKANGQVGRDNHTLTSTIARCLDHEITNLNAIMLFATFETGINTDDIKSMKMFLNMFGNSGVKIALCITHADFHDSRWRELITSQLLNHATIAKFIRNESMRILFMGCVDCKSSKYDTEERLTNAYIEMGKLRNGMLSFIFGAHMRVSLRDMNITKHQLHEISKQISSAGENMRTFIAGDFNIKKTKNAEQVDSHLDLLKELTETKITVTLPDAITLMIGMIDVIEEVEGSNMITDQFKGEILGKFSTSRTLFK